MGFLKKLFGAADHRPPVDTAHTEPPTPHEEEQEPEMPFANIGSADAEAGIAAGRYQVVDVRFPHEYAMHRIPGALLIPLPELQRRVGELDPARETLVVCEHGMRSMDGAYFLTQQGFANVGQLECGMAGYRGPKESGPVTGA